MLIHRGESCGAVECDPSAEPWDPFVPQPEKSEGKLGVGSDPLCCIVYRCNQRHIDIGSGPCSI